MKPLQFTDADGGVTQDFVQKLQALNSHNSKHELSIEKFLTKSEEAFFDKVKKDKLSSAASVRSSQRDSVWGTPAPSTFDHSRPSSPMGASSFVPGADGYSGPIPGENGEVVMTGLQIAQRIARQHHRNIVCTGTVYDCESLQTVPQTN